MRPWAIIFVFHFAGPKVLLALNAQVHACAHNHMVTWYAPPPIFRSGEAVGPELEIMPGQHIVTVKGSRALLRIFGG